MKKCNVLYINVLLKVKVFNVKNVWNFFLNVIMIFCLLCLYSYLDNRDF